MCNMHGGEELIFQSLVCTEAHESEIDWITINGCSVDSPDGWIAQEWHVLVNTCLPSHFLCHANKRTTITSQAFTSVAFLSDKVFPTHHDREDDDSTVAICEWKAGCCKCK